MRRLSQLLGEELEAYGEIRRLADAQTELLANDNVEEFNNLLCMRGSLIEEINELQPEKVSLLQSYDNVTMNSNGEGVGVDVLLERVRNELSMCVKINDEHIKTMGLKVAEYSKRIEDQSTMRKGIGGYAQAVPSMPEMFDGIH